MQSSEIVEIACCQIIPGNNDRKDFPPEELATLAVSISENGLAQPITVRPIVGEGQHPISQYEIVAGERRFRAISQILAWPAIPAIIRDLTDEEASALMLAENTSRADLNPIDEANAYQTRIQRFAGHLP